MTRKKRRRPKWVEQTRLVNMVFGTFALYKVGQGRERRKKHVHCEVIGTGTCAQTWTGRRNSQKGGRKRRGRKRGDRRTMKKKKKIRYERERKRKAKNQKVFETSGAHEQSTEMKWKKRRLSAFQRWNTGPLKLHKLPDFGACTWVSRFLFHFDSKLKKK